jgi:isochorismate hydrolase
MKEIYFTPENIQTKAKNMIFDVEKIVRTKKIDVDFEKAALIVLDMQEFFLNEKSHAFIPSSPSIIPNIKNLVENFHNKKRPVIFTKHINTPANAGMMGDWWKDILTPKNEYSDLSKKLEAKNSIIIEKTQYDAFYNTDLETVLRQKKIEQVVITGVMTHLCCETTARSAFTRSFQSFLVIDATATYNESFHRASTLNLAHGFSKLVLAEDLT